MKKYVNRKEEKINCKCEEILLYKMSKTNDFAIFPTYERVIDPPGFFPNHFYKKLIGNRGQH